MARTPVNRILAQFGDNIISFRKKLGMTQIELAALVGVSRVTITNIETGQNATTIDNLLKFCAIFDCTPTELLPPVPVLKIEESEEEKVTVIKVHKGSFEWQ